MYLKYTPFKLCPVSYFVTSMTKIIDTTFQYHSSMYQVTRISNVIEGSYWMRRKKQKICSSLSPEKSLWFHRLFILFKQNLTRAKAELLGGWLPPHTGYYIPVLCFRWYFCHQWADSIFLNSLVSDKNKSANCWFNSTIYQDKNKKSHFCVFSLHFGWIRESVAQIQLSQFLSPSCSSFIHVCVNNDSTEKSLQDEFRWSLL